MFLHFYPCKEFQSKRVTCNSTVKFKFRNMFRLFVCAALYKHICRPYSMVYPFGMWQYFKEFTLLSHSNRCNLITAVYAFHCCFLHCSWNNLLDFHRRRFLPGGTDNKPVASNFSIIFFKFYFVIKIRRISFIGRYLYKEHRSLLSHS